MAADAATRAATAVLRETQSQDWWTSYQYEEGRSVPAFRVERDGPRVQVDWVVVEAAAPTSYLARMMVAVRDGLVSPIT